MEFPPAEVMFESADEAHDYLMKIVSDVCVELREVEGINLPPASKFAKDCLRIWRFWQTAGYIRP